VGIWITVPVAAFFATRGYLGGPTSTDRAAAMSSLCFLPAYGIHCYGDIGLQSLTCGLLFGVSMAIAAKVSAFAQQGAAAVVARPERTAPPLRVASVSYP
jgi:hypothetical protein